jgi:hypothetical protein
MGLRTFPKTTAKPSDVAGERERFYQCQNVHGKRQFSHLLAPAPRFIGSASTERQLTESLSICCKNPPERRSNDLTDRPPRRSTSPAAVSTLIAHRQFHMPSLISNPLHLGILESQERANSHITEQLPRSRQPSSSSIAVRSIRKVFDTPSICAFPTTLCSSCQS